MDVDGSLSDAELDERLHALDPFFAEPSGNVPEAVRPLVESVSDLHERLWSGERRTTFLGAFKAGKTSLVNTLIGAPLLPVRANRATGVVTIIRPGMAWAALVVRGGPEGPREESISLAQVGEAVLLDLSTALPSPPAGVEEVRLEAPLSWLHGRLVLIDTPGLLEQEMLTQRSYDALERSDLAVLVLSADKILSSRERDLAHQIDGLLHGNVVYALNRMDLVEEEDRAEVVEWARTALAGSGNRLVGKPCIFMISAEAVEPESTMHEGVAGFHRWLTALWSTPTGDRVAVLSRLGILEQHLCRIETHLRAELVATRHTTEQVRREEAQALARERARIIGQIGAGRAALRLCLSALPDLGETFVSACLEGARQHINRPGERAQVLRVPFEAALARYAESATHEVQAAILDLPVTAPSFELNAWIVRGDVEPAASPATEIGARFGDLMTRAIDGGSAGREAGAMVGSWIGKNLFGLDAERETLERVERLARGTAAALQREAERYIDRVDGLLAEAEEFYREWTRTSARVVAAEDTEQIYDDLTQWCVAFLLAVRAIVSEIMG